MIYGTSYFVSLNSAVHYYRAMNYTREDIKRKIADGEIHIGKPPITHGQYIVYLDSGTRYGIADTRGD